MSIKIKKANIITAGLLFSAGSLLSSPHLFAAESEVSGFLENATYIRDGVGLSKFRNTGQLEVYKPIEDSGNWSKTSINGVFRATYDGVYDLNDDEFGEDAPQQSYLGQSWHPANNWATEGPSLPFIPTAFPCENGAPDLCKNMKDYADHSEDDLKYPDFNDHFDFIRELYLDTTYNMDNGDKLSFRLGKQQVVWGKTDLFRVLDIINPVDYSRHNIFDQLEDIRIPQWMLQAEWRMGKTALLDDSNLSLVWNFDEFRPHFHGVCGGAYQVMDLGCFYTSHLDLNPTGPSMLWPSFSDVDLPNWSLGNTQGGIKWEGVAGDITFSLNAYSFLQQDPALTLNADPMAAGGFYGITFPRVNLVGGSIDYYSPSIDTVLRLETTHTSGEKLPAYGLGHIESDMWRYVIGFDKSVYLPNLSSSAFMVSGQLFGMHVLDHQKTTPIKEDNWIATMLIKGFWKNNRLSPQLVIAHDFGADATAFNPSVEYLIDDHWKIDFALNIKTGGNKEFNTNALAAEMPGNPPLGVWEPLSRFANGPIGVAHQEDEAQITIRYSF